MIDVKDTFDGIGQCVDFTVGVVTFKVTSTII